MLRTVEHYGTMNASLFSVFNGTMNFSEFDDYECVETMNISAMDYLLMRRGPKQLPLEVAVPLTVLNLLIFISGLLGNLAVCLVIIKHSNMHTATNYYLFNLAISDLTLLIFGLPNDVAVYWHQYPWILGEEFCKIRALLSEMASYGSVLTIVAFSTERYLSICYPLYLYTMSGLQRAIRIISCLWLISFISALPFSLYTKIYYIYYPPNCGDILEESAFCGMLEMPENFPLAEISTIVFFIIPMLIIAVQYTMMGYRISNRTQLSFGNNATGSVHRDSRRSQSHKAIVRMLAAVVIGFFVCWAPFHAQRLVFIYLRNSMYFNTINQWMFFITGILYYFSSTLNPILYNVMSNKYRTAFKEILCGGRQQNGTLMKNSTFRETRFPAHSNSDRMEARCTLSQNVNDDETMILVHNRDIIRVSSPKGKNSLVYQLNYCEIKPNSETCI